MSETVAFMDDSTGEFIYRTTRVALGRSVVSSQLKKGALFRINGKDWRVVRVFSYRPPYLRVDVVATDAMLEFCGL